MARKIGRAATREGRMLEVRRDAYFVQLGDEAVPHTAWTLHREDARRLAEALLKASDDDLTSTHKQGGA